MAHISDYEKQRLKNLADNRAMLAQIMGDLPGMKRPSSARLSMPQMKKRSRSTLNADAAYGAKNATVNAWYNPPRTRSRSASVSSSMSSDIAARSPGKLLVRIDSIARRRRRASVEEGGSDSENGDIIFYGEESDDEAAPTDAAWNDSAATRTQLPCRKNKTPKLSKAPEDVTEEDLANVAMVVSDKKYDDALGITCHQCRQKTLDMKTICRSGRCTGTRGQFCGPCLRNRYGEDAREALQNPEWICPSCRGICNCSLCRKRAGKPCTGILIHCARESGYDSVSSFLQGSKI